MESRAKVLAQPAHPILIVYPLGLWSTVTVFDVIHLFNDSARPADAAFWRVVAGALAGLVATALVFFTGWLGGELIHRLGVSVDDGANLDAPNSLSGRLAAERAVGAGRRGT